MTKLNANTLTFKAVNTRNSEPIAIVAYNEELRILRLVWEKTAAGYDYLDVPSEIFDEMINAPSVGKYANKVVKQQFDFRKLTGAESNRFLLNLFKMSQQEILEIPGNTDYQ